MKSTYYARKYTAIIKVAKKKSEKGKDERICPPVDVV